MKKRMIRGCMSSVGRLCIIQKQDSPEPGAFARMNFPGTLSTADWTRRTASVRSPGATEEDNHVKKAVAADTAFLFAGMWTGMDE